MPHRVRRSMLRHTTGGPAGGQGSLFRRCSPLPLWDQSAASSVSTGTGEAARMALSLVGAEGVVVGADISPAMLTSACVGLHGSSFLPVAADGQALPFRDASFDAVVCQLGLQFFPDPAQGVGEFRRVLGKGGRVAICAGVDGFSSPRFDGALGVTEDERKV
jgi:SAM-dependent methyltransferase